MEAKKDYIYRHDPDHKKRPEGGGWEKTEKGWSKGTGEKGRADDEQKNHVPSSPHHLNFMQSLEEASKNVRGFVSRDIADCREASDTVKRKYGDHRTDYSKIDDMIVGFADMKKPRVAHQLSALIGYRYNLPPDFRMTGKPPVPKDINLLRSLDRYITREQKILKSAGIVNEDDTVTLFRNTDENQIDAVELGESTSYRGSNIESWTTRSDLNWRPGGRVTMKVMARIPLKYCIASCVGRERAFMKKQECEVMVCGTFVKEALYVGHGTIEMPGIEQAYLNEVEDNISRHLESQKKDAASKTSSRKAVFAAREILKIAKEILKDTSVTSYKNNAAQRPNHEEMTMSRKKKNEKPITERISPLYLKFYNQTHSAYKALELMDKYRKEHGIKLPPPPNPTVEEMLELDKEEAKRKWEACGIPWDEEEYYREYLTEEEYEERSRALGEIDERRCASWEKDQAAGMSWDEHWEKYKREHPEEKPYQLSEEGYAEWKKAVAAGVTWDDFWERYQKSHPWEKLGW